jgi:hypothetical protein
MTGGAGAALPSGARCARDPGRAEVTASRGLQPSASASQVRADDRDQRQRTHSPFGEHREPPAASACIHRWFPATSSLERSFNSESRSSNWVERPALHGTRPRPAAPKSPVHGCFRTLHWSSGIRMGSAKSGRKRPQASDLVQRGCYSTTVPDPDRSLDEPRYITAGQSGSGRLLMVSPADRGNRIRIRQ